MRHAFLWSNRRKSIVSPSRGGLRLRPRAGERAGDRVHRRDRLHRHEAFRRADRRGPRGAAHPPRAPQPDGRLRTGHVRTQTGSQSTRRLFLILKIIPLFMSLYHKSEHNTFGHQSLSATVLCGSCHIVVTFFLGAAHTK
eukprot:gene206-biopygen15